MIATLLHRVFTESGMHQFPADECDGSIWRCFIAPCTNFGCDQYPDAICINDYCDGCWARFFDPFDVNLTDELNCSLPVIYEITRKCM